MEKTVSFGDRAAVPAIGQGTWYMGETAPTCAGGGCTTSGRGTRADGHRHR
jgi:diketogulonate reductase-like aldo/keto reductase